MKRIILGTAGHIDHGKTTFVKSLTGIDCDILKEEKERGITIELGYAHLMLPSGIKVGIVDVPGHEKFVSKMVAGAFGIDVVALIIAADEGVMPQTREHIYICNLLGVKRGIVVLTKKDLVDEELLELQKEDIRDFLQDTQFKDAPIIAVSSTTGDGLGDFIKVLDDIAKEVTEKPVDMPFRMPIDAVISIKGFGTVIRGTAISGTIKRGQVVYILPQGIEARVRGLQSHGENIMEGWAGERIAINFSDIPKEALERGMVVVSHNIFEPTSNILIELSYLSYNEKPLKAKFTCQFHILTSKVNADVYLLNKEKLLPGETAYGMVKMAKPVILSYGDKYVVRGYGIYTTIGGGRVLNPKIPTFDRNYFTEDYLKILTDGKLEEVIPLFIKERGDEGITLDRLVALVNTEYGKVTNTLDVLIRKGTLFEDDKKQYFHRDVVEHFKETMLNLVYSFHKENPLKLGINKDELQTKIGCSERLFLLILKILQEEKRLLLKGELVCKVGFKIEGDTEELFKKVEELFRSYGIAPEEPVIVAEKLRIDIKKIKEILASLVRQGRMHKINDSYFVTTEVLEKAMERLRDFFSKKEILTPQDIRELFGVSRKFIIPFLEYLDSIKFTIRVSDGRKLRK